MSDPLIKTEDGAYLLSERQTLLLCMFADAKEAGNAHAIREEMVKVLMAWRRGKLLPRWEVPHLAGICDDFNKLDQGLPLAPLPPRKDER